MLRDTPGHRAPSHLDGRGDVDRVASSAHSTRVTRHGVVHTCDGQVRSDNDATANAIDVKITNALHTASSGPLVT